jgi:hypothetical protein
MPWLIVIIHYDSFLWRIRWCICPYLVKLFCQFLSTFHVHSISPGFIKLFVNRNPFPFPMRTAWWSREAISIWSEVSLKSEFAIKKLDSESGSNQTLHFRLPETLAHWNFHSRNRISMVHMVYGRETQGIDIFSI